MKGNRSVRLKSLRKDNMAMAKAIGAMIALLVAIIIGVLVFYEVNDNVQWDNTNTSNEHAKYRDARNSSNDTASTVFTLLPIIAIVLIASIILGVVTGFGARPGGGI